MNNNCTGGFVKRFIRNFKPWQPDWCLFISWKTSLIRKRSFWEINCDKVMLLLFLCVTILVALWNNLFVDSLGWNDIFVDSQIVLWTPSAAPRESADNIWPLWWRILLPIWVQAKLDHNRFVKLPDFLKQRKGLWLLFKVVMSKIFF